MKFNVHRRGLVLFLAVLAFSAVTKQAFAQVNGVRNASLVTDGISGTSESHTFSTTIMAFRITFGGLHLPETIVLDHILLQK